MASFGRQRVFGRIVVMLMIIIAIIIGGLFWFDYLGVLDAKSLFSPALKLPAFQSGPAMPSRRMLRHCWKMNGWPNNWHR
jgi:hypothetical protein